MNYPAASGDFPASPDDTGSALAGLDLSTLPEVRQIITCTIEGFVEPSDLAALASAKPQMPQGGNAGDLKRIKEKHHHVAQLIAGGMTQSLVCTIVGYTDAYLSTLLNTPSMQELVAHYRSSHTAAHEIMTRKLQVLSHRALDGLDDQLSSGELDVHGLLGIAKLGLDRSGFGPRSTVVAHSEQHIIDHAELMRLQRNALSASADDIIDIQALPAPQKETDDADEISQ